MCSRLSTLLCIPDLGSGPGEYLEIFIGIRPDHPSTRKSSRASEYSGLRPPSSFASETPDVPFQLEGLGKPSYCASRTTLHLLSGLLREQGGRDEDALLDLYRTLGSLSKLELAVASPLI